MTNKLTTGLTKKAAAQELGEEEAALLEACKAATAEDLAGEEIELDETADERF